MSGDKRSIIKFELKFEKRRILELSLGLITFILIFFNWCKLRFSLLGYTTVETFSLFRKGMFDISTFLGFAKICLILELIIFVIYIVTLFVDIKKVIPNLKIDVTKLIPKIYYILYILAIIFSLIGLISVDFCRPNVSWYFALIFCLLGIIVIFKPKLLEDFRKKVFKK